MEKKSRPPWLVGLLLAISIFVIVLLVANLLGYGDDPAISDTDALWSRLALSGLYR